MDLASILLSDTPLGILKALDGYYECPKDDNGTRKGPLVGYAATYKNSSEEERQFVGDIYCNFAKAEQYPSVMHHFAELFFKNNSEIIMKADVIVGPQMGGVSIAQMLAFVAGKKFAIIEKKITRLATKDLREQSELKFLRHEIKEGEKVFSMEDVVNNFSTTGLTIIKIEEAGADVIALGGLLNRSLKFDKEFILGQRKLPIVSLIRKPFTEWRQDDPEVIGDVKAGNIILKPKDEWQKLRKVMDMNKPNIF